jgi:copper(I)-binding protein
MPDGTGQGRKLAARRGPVVAVLTVAAALTATALSATALSGCGGQPAAVMPIKVASAYVMQANGIKAVDAYFVLANSGSADQLLAVHSSAGGKVLMLDPDAPGLSAARTLSAISIPAHSTTKLDPAGLRLEIIDSGPLHDGTDITLTLVFAHAGQLKVLAQVNNPQTGNSGYFGP